MRDFRINPGIHPSELRVSRAGVDCATNLGV
jgi:hypothetical protein